MALAPRVAVVDAAVPGRLAVVVAPPVVLVLTGLRAWACALVLVSILRLGFVLFPLGVLLVDRGADALTNAVAALVGVIPTDLVLALIRRAKDRTEIAFARFP